MIVPNVMPDEWSRSFLGRICMLNGTSEPEDLKPSLNRMYADAAKPTAEKNWTELLAAAANLSVPSFHALHTLFPFFRTVRPTQHCIPYGGVGDQQESAAYSRHGSPGSYMFLCPACTKEDVDFWGFSYWRRSHQLFGTVYCQKHEVGFHEVQKAGWCVSPHDALLNARPPATDATVAALHNAVIRRYVEISAALAERTQPVSTEWMVHVLRRQVRATESEHGSLAGALTDLAKKRVPAAWLGKFFPGLDVARNDNSLERTCVTIGRPLATPYYTLALALLFRDADEAITEVSKLPIGACDTSENSASTSRAASNAAEKRLQAAFRAFLAGASIREATDAQRIDASALEVLLRSSAAQLTRPRKRKVALWHSSKSMP